MSRKAYLMVIGLAAAGCASAPPVVTATGIAEFTTPRSFDVRLAQPASEAEVAAADVVTERLKANGWNRRPDAPEVLLEVAYTARTDSGGAYVGDVRPETSAGWLEAPRPRRWWSRVGDRHALSVRLVDPATGNATAALVAAVQTRKQAPPPWEGLSGALMRSLSQAAGNSTPKTEPSGPAS